MKKFNYTGMRACCGFALLCGTLLFGTANTSGANEPATRASSAPASAIPERSRMWMTIGERRFALTLADTEAARALATLLPFEINMAELNGNEKHADLPKSLPTNPSRPGTIRNGDILLYGSDTLVVFYLTFNSSYSYTRLGRVDDPSGLREAVGKGSVRIKFSPD